MSESINFNEIFEHFINDIQDMKNLDNDYNNKLKDFYNHRKQPLIIPDFLSKNICNFIVSSAEKLAYTNLKMNKFVSTDGWSNRRHRNYPTTDLPLDNFPLINNFFNKFIIYNIFPKLEEYTSINKLFFNISDVFIVKYDSEKQNSLAPHQDGTLFSFNILLNPSTDFEGGGTQFYNNDTKSFDLYTINQGDILIHSGKITHAGKVITSGKRYIIVGFINLFQKNNCDIVKKLSTPNNYFKLDFFSNDQDDKNIDTFIIQSQHEDDLLDYYENEINYLNENKNNKSKNCTIHNLDVKSDNMDVIEKFIYELYIFHMKRLNLYDQLDDYYVEFWTNINVINHLSPKILKYAHSDKDELMLKKNNKLIKPILSTITYIDKTVTPTIITNTKAKNEYIQNEFNNNSDLFINDVSINLHNGFSISFPDNMKHLSFNGENYHSVLNFESYQSNTTSEYDDIEHKYRITLCFNIFKKEKNYIIKPEYNKNKCTFSKSVDYFNIKQCNKKKIIYIKNYEMYEYLTNIVKNNIDYEFIDILKEKCKQHDIYDVFDFKCFLQ